MNQSSDTRRTWNTQAPLLIGVVALLLFLGIAVVWGTLTSISGAVVAKGTVRVSSTKTALQHPKGGVVAEVLAENGDKVNADDVVIRLDDAQLRWEQKIIEGELFEILANSARLTSIIERREDLDTHPLLQQQEKDDHDVGVMMNRQKDQLQSHYKSLAAQDGLLAEQINQVRSQIKGAEAQLEAQRQQLEIDERELVRLVGVQDKGLVTITQVEAVRKETVKTRGGIGALNADIAAFNGKILELELMRQNLVPRAIDLAVDELNLLRQRTSKLLEQRNSILDDLSHLEIRSPISGIVHDSKIQGLRSVVVAATPLMYIVSDDLPATLSAQVEVYDIDQVYRGQQALVKFTALHNRAMLNTYGEVTKISADALLDDKTKKYFYEVEVFLPAEELEKLGKNLLVSGMPAVVYLTTMSRTPAEYITRPIRDFLGRALKDT